MTTFNKIRMTIVCMAIVMIGCVCGAPDKPTIETGIIQSAQAANASLLAQVDWKSIFARVRGKIGPDTEITVQVKQIIGGEVSMHFRGAELEYEMTGAGTGGGWETNKDIWPDLMQIQQRWERADDASKRDLRIWEAAVADAIVKKLRESTSQPSDPEPEPEKAPTP